MQVGKFDAQRSAQVGSESFDPAAVLSNGLALEEEPNHLWHLGGDLVDANRIVGQCAV